MEPYLLLGRFTVFCLTIIALVAITYGQAGIANEAITTVHHLLKELVAPKNSGQENQ